MMETLQQAIQLQSTDQMRLGNLREALDVLEHSNTAAPVSLAYHPPGASRPKLLDLDRQDAIELLLGEEARLKEAIAQRNVALRAAEAAFTQGIKEQL